MHIVGSKRIVSWLSQKGFSDPLGQVNDIITYYNTELPKYLQLRNYFVLHASGHLARRPTPCLSIYPLQCAYATPCCHTGFIGHPSIINAAENTTR